MFLYLYLYFLLIQEPKSKRQCTNFICDNVYNEMKVAATNMHCDGDRDRTVLVPMKTPSQTYMTENRVPQLHSQYSPQVLYKLIVTL